MSGHRREVILVFIALSCAALVWIYNAVSLDNTVAISVADIGHGPSRLAQVHVRTGAEWRAAIARDNAHPCLNAVSYLAYQRELHHVVQHFSVRQAPRWLPSKGTPTSSPGTAPTSSAGRDDAALEGVDYVTEETLEYKLGSVCFLNARWVGYVLGAPDISVHGTPYPLPRDLRASLMDSSTWGQHRAIWIQLPWMEPDPAFKSPGLPFFYHTHSVMVQQLPSQQRGQRPRFQMYAAFVRHYRMSEWLQGEAGGGYDGARRLSYHEFVNGYLVKLQEWLDIINTGFVWTERADILHFDLFGISKFGDMEIGGRIPLNTIHRVPLLPYRPSRWNKATIRDYITARTQRKSGSSSSSGSGSGSSNSSSVTAGNYIIRLRTWMFNPSHCQARAESLLKHSIPIGKDRSGKQRFLPLRRDCQTTKYYHKDCHARWSQSTLSTGS